MLQERQNNPAKKVYTIIFLFICSQRSKQMNFVGGQILEFYKKNPVLTTSNIALALTFPLDDVLIPFLIGKIVTQVQNRGEWLKYLIVLAIVIVCVQIMYSLTMLHDAKLEPMLQNHVRHSITSDLMEKYKNQKQELELGEITSRFVRIPLATIGLYDDMKNYILPYAISFVITSCIIFGYDKVMGISLFLCTIIIFITIIKSPYHCNSTATHVDDKLAEIDENNEDILKNAHIVYTSNQFGAEMQRLHTMEKSYASAYYDTITCVVKQRFVGIVLLSILLVTFVARSYIGLTRKTLSIGAFVTVFTIIVQWFGILGWLTSNIKEIVMDYSIINAYEKMADKFVGRSKSVQPNTEKYNVNLKGLLVDNITVYTKERQDPIIKDFSLYVKPGERVAIVGNIGVGKSTLLKVIVGLRKPDQGHVYYDGVEVNEQRSSIGYVQQNPILLNRTIYENITYGIQGVTEEQINVLLNKLGLSDIFKNLNNGLESKVSINLSGGQRQIIQCLRVMLLNPKVIVLDEITSSVDIYTKDKLMKLLKEMFVDKTVIFVTHDKDLLQIATRIITMK